MMEPLNWAEQLSELADLTNLRSVRSRFKDWLNGSSRTLDPINLHEAVNQFHDRLIGIVSRRALSVYTSKSGHLPEIPFAFVLFGSGGRREQTPWSDQDNAIIYQVPHGGDLEVYHHYFNGLAAVWSDMLCQVGYPPCVGNVICTNPKWCRSAVEWQLMIDGWWEQCHWEDVRHLLIIADARVICGEEAVWQPIRETYLTKVASDPEYIRILLRNTLHHKVALGFFGNFLKERYGTDAGGVDIKYGGYIPMVNAIRLLAIFHGITRSSTIERIQALLPFYGEEEINNWTDTFYELMFWRSNTPFTEEDGLYNSTGVLRTDLLEPLQKKQLKSALRTAMKLQKRIEQVTHFRRE